MLICPQCEFENPKENKFCQNCGVSLTHKVCCECQEDIPIEAKTCNLCGAANHTVLWAIISQKKTKKKSETSPELLQVVGQVNHSQTQLKIENLSDLFANSQGKNSLPLKIKPEDTTHTYNRYALKHDSSSSALFETKHRDLENIFLELNKVKHE